MSGTNCRVVTVVGARPQFVKAAMLSLALADSGPLCERLIHTGQHFDDNMSGVFFDELGLAPPALNLGIGGGSHGQNTGRMIEALESVFASERPEVVVVFGDTDSTLAATIAAIKLRIPVAHVESGLRSFNRAMPEEHNRVLADHAATFLYAPTETAVRNLAREGIGGDHVILVGDVMYDATRHFGDLALRRSTILAQLSIRAGDYVLATIHRAENTDDPARLTAIFDGFGRCGRNVVLPLHPRTGKRLKEFSIGVPGNLRLIDPVGYLDMLALERAAAVVATDSGGVQKEAYFSGVPCVTLRNETEWVELVEAGANRLVGNDPESIAEALVHCLPLPTSSPPLYGDGRAARHIVRHLESCLVR